MAGTLHSKITILFMFVLLTSLALSPATLAADRTEFDIKANGTVSTASTGIQYVDLENWTWVAPGDANWVVEPGGRTVTQTVNSSSPGMYMSDVDLFNRSIICEFEVTDTGDNDYVGFALGMQSPTDRVTTNYEFILFDWKKSWQSTSAEEGFSLVRVNGNFPIAGYGDQYFWNHTDTGPGATPEFDILATNYGVGKGWQANTRYEVRILYTATRIKIKVDDQVIFDETGTFQNGKVGFYCLSQEKVHFRAVKHAPASDVEQPPVANDDNYSATRGNTITKDRFEGILSNDFDYNLDDYVISADTSGMNGSITVNTDGSFTYTPTADFIGTDTFTYYITDDDGDSNTGTVSFVMMETNAAPTDIQLSNQKVPAGHSNGTEIGTFTTTDSNTGDVHDYMLIDNGGGRFGVVNDKLVVANSSAIDATGQYSITVRSTDLGGLHIDKTFTIFGGDTAQLQITTSPSTGQWRETGTSTWNNSGDTITIAANTDVSVEFSSVASHVTPSNKTYNGAADEVITDTVTYTAMPASLQITTSPSSGQWRITGSSTWNDSGYTQTVLTHGSTVTVEFNSVSNYDTPTNRNYTLVGGSTITDTVSYTLQNGTLKISMNIDDGRWRQVGTSAWKASADTMSFSAGSVEVEFLDVAYHDKPANQAYTINGNQLTTGTADYTVHTGGLQITTDPADGKWRISGETAWNNSGDTVSGIDHGTEVTVEFQSVTNYDTPANQTYTIVGDKVQSETVSYTLQDGTLEISMNINDGRWRQVGTSAWKASADTVTIPAGSVEVEFKDVTNYDTPANQTLTINGNQLTTASATYVKQVGSLKLTITPGAAQWRITGTSTWNNSGDTVGDILIGTTSVEFSDVYGYQTPAIKTYTINQGATTTASVNYENATGNLTVNLEPTTGTWRIAGNETWYTSGQTATGIVEGTYTLEFGSARGYYDRTSEQITIVRDTTLVRSYSYERIVGSLQVHLNPGQAKWRLTGQIGWRPSGDVQEGISVGDYDVEFSTVTGFITPGDSRVTVRENQTTYLNITYQENRQSGSVNVTILPEEAAAAGMQWRISGQTGWLESGETVEELVTGNHTVEFSSVANWQSPADRDISVKTNQTTSITATAVKSSAPRIHYFTATPENIGGEEESLLEWLVRGADTVSLDHGLGTDLDHESSIKVSPQQSSTYKLTATNASGTSTAVIDVNVLQKPEIDWFKSSHGPDNPACEGEEISFSWKVVGAEKVSLDTDGDGAGDVSLASEYGQHTLTCGGSEQVYTLIAESPVGTSSSKIIVPVTQLPSVVSFTAKQDAILYGRSTVLKWKTFGGTAVEIHPGLGSFDLTGSTSIRPESDTVYTLVVTNDAGEVTASQTVTVHDPDKVSDLSIEIEAIDEDLLAELNEGDTLPVDVTVTNSGTVDAFDFDITLRDPRQIADRQYLEVLKAGQSKTITMSYVAVAKGVNRFKAFVDYLDEVVESSEANNVAKAMIKTGRADKVDLLPYDLQVVAYEGTDDVEAVTVSFKIKNIGSKHSDGFQYRVYLNYPNVKGYKNSSELLDVYNVDELKSGKVYKVSTIGYLKNYQKRAKFKVVVEVDTLLAIDETNEVNNNIEKVITKKYIF